MEFFGATPGLLAQWRTEDQALHLPEAMRNLAEVFLALQSQWCWHRGQITGLNYPGIVAYLTLSRRTLCPTDFLHLQCLEALCLEQFQSA